MAFKSDTSGKGFNKPNIFYVFIPKFVPEVLKAAETVYVCVCVERERQTEGELEMESEI